MSNDAGMKVFSKCEYNANLKTTYNRANSVVIKNNIILNIKHNISHLRDTEVVI
jgi:hypothetical protein